MSQQNLERVRRTFDAFARGDFHTALQDVRMEVRTHRIAPLPDPKIYQGPAGMLMAWGEWTAPFEELELTVGELIEAGQSVVAEIRQSGRQIDGGLLVEERFWFVCTFLDGALVQWDMLASKHQALKGVGRRDTYLDGPENGRA
jgi:ketosteroid isomerase-like protein